MTWVNQSCDITPIDDLPKTLGQGELPNMTSNSLQLGVETGSLQDWELTYPNLKNGKSSSNTPWVLICNRSQDGRFLYIQFPLFWRHAPRKT